MVEHPSHNLEICNYLGSLALLLTETYQIILLLQTRGSVSEWPKFCTVHPSGLISGFKTH